MLLWKLYCLSNDQTISLAAAFFPPEGPLFLFFVFFSSFLKFSVCVYMSVKGWLAEIRCPIPHGPRVTNFRTSLCSSCLPARSSLLSISVFKCLFFSPFLSPFLNCCFVWIFPFSAFSLLLIQENQDLIGYVYEVFLNNNFRYLYCVYWSYSSLLSLMGCLKSLWT